MELYNPKNTDLLQRFTESIGKNSPIRLPQNIIQKAGLSSSDMESIFGTSEQFLEKYKNFEEVVFSMMENKKYLAFGQEAVDVQSMRKLGRLDLSVFNYEARNNLTAQFAESVLNIDKLLSTAGLPGMEFPSGNLYSSLMKFDINQTEKDTHAAFAFLNRTFFNINPNKAGKLGFNFGTSSLLTSEGLQRSIEQQSKNFKPLGNILTFDVETTGVTKGSQVRSWAGKITDDTGRAIDNGEFKVAFENMQMANATVRTEKGSMLLSEGVNIIEKSENARSMANGGKEFIEQSKILFREMLNPEIKHLSGHNVLFDVMQMHSTINALEAKDDEVIGLMGSVFDRIAGQGQFKGQENFLIDTRETLTSYFAKKAQEKGIETSDKAMRLLAPESMAKIEIGGSTAPSSIENIVVNSNVLELIENESKLQRCRWRRRKKTNEKNTIRISHCRNRRTYAIDST